MIALTLAIVALSAAAFARTQALKQVEPPIAGIEVDAAVVPGCDCPRETARLSFTLARAQPVDAAVVDEEGQAVRTLLDGVLQGSGRVTLMWDGAGEDGESVPAGDYRLRVELAVPERTIVIPSDIRVEPEGGPDRGRPG